MSLFTKLLLYLVLQIFVLSGAHAQLAVNPAPQNQPVCLEKSDAFLLAEADKDGTLATVWSIFVEEGRCWKMPASYLWTLDHYKDIDNGPSRVVELLAFGERVYGIRGALPSKGVWLMSYGDSE